MLRAREATAFSNALGIAGFTNLDVVRNPTLGSQPYLARGLLHYIVPLSKDKVEVTRNPLSLHISRYAVWNSGSAR